MAVNVTSVAANTSPQTLSAGNPNKTEVSVYYDGAAILYVLVGEGTVSTSNYSFKMGDGFLTYWELPDAEFTGKITGIWSAATGAAVVTEYV